MLPRLALLACRGSAPSSTTSSGAWNRLQPAAATASSFASKTTPTTATPPADSSRGATADLLDIFHPQSVDDASTPRTVHIAEPIFRDFGGRLRFSGQAATIKCFENNPLVRAALEEKGQGRALVVDGGGSKRCALLGDNIAAMGARNGWSGIIIHGKRDLGQRDVPVSFAGVTIKPGDWVYADGDGVIVSETELKLESKV